MHAGRYDVRTAVQWRHAARTVLQQHARPKDSDSQDSSFLSVCKAIARASDSPDSSSLAVVDSVTDSDSPGSSSPVVACKDNSQVNNSQVACKANSDSNSSVVEWAEAWAVWAGFEQPLIREVLG